MPIIWQVLLSSALKLVEILLKRNCSCEVTISQFNALKAKVEESKAQSKETNS